jgi:hypothetical protein
MQLIDLAMMRAQVVLPTPRGPQNKNACARILFLIAFFSVVVMAACPTTVSKVIGLYFRAETTKLSMEACFNLAPKIGINEKQDAGKFQFSSANEND